MWVVLSRMKPAIDSVLGASVIAAALLVRWTHMSVDLLLNDYTFFP